MLSAKIFQDKVLEKFDEHSARHIAHDVKIFEHFAKLDERCL